MVRAGPGAQQVQETPTESHPGSLGTARSEGLFEVWYSGFSLPLGGAGGEETVPCLALSAGQAGSRSQPSDPRSRPALPHSPGGTWPFKLARTLVRVCSHRTPISFLRVPSPHPQHTDLFADEQELLCTFVFESVLNQLRVFFGGFLVFLVGFWCSVHLPLPTYQS